MLEPKLAAKRLKSKSFTRPSKLKSPCDQRRSPSPSPKFAARRLKSVRFTRPSRLTSPYSVGLKTMVVSSIAWPAKAAGNVPKSSLGSAWLVPLLSPSDAVALRLPMPVHAPSAYPCASAAWIRPSRPSCGSPDQVSQRPAGGAEVGGKPVEIAEVHRPIEVEVALAPVPAWLAEVGGEAVEVREVHPAVEVRVAVERVADQHGGVVDGFTDERR